MNPALAEELINGIASVLNNGDCSEENNMDKIRLLYAEYLSANERLKAEGPFDEHGNEL
jgi:hypothetical protein